MGFLPSGSVAYQQYISGSIPTFVTSLKQQGYRTIGMHPYNSNGWNRSAIYPYLGFDETYFRDDFTNAQIFREYVSDASSYQKIIELYETKESDENLFIFEVTMQNHGGYSTIYDNFPLTISLTDIQGHEATENYLSLVKESDQALNDLVNYFQGVEEDTIIMMFGDHQPNDYVATCIANLTGTASEDRSLEELQNRYIVPFVLWANFDIPAEHNITTSANYLNLLLTQLTDIENTPYQDYLSTLQTQLPVITANVCIDTNGNYYTVSEAKQNEQFKSGLNLYEQAQYEYLFDSKHRDDSLFGN